MVLAGCVCYVNSLVRLVQGQQRIVHHVCKGILTLATSALLNVRLDIFVTRRQVNVIFVRLNVQVVWVHQHIALAVQLGTNFSYPQYHAFHNVQNTRLHKAHSVLHANTHVCNAHLKPNVSAVSLAV